MDWDKVRIFHAAAHAGSFTHASGHLQMSQSAVSRQVSALEEEVGVPLFHRHARGLILTEQGELLYRTATEVMLQLDSVQTKLVDMKDKPTGRLRVNTTVGLGSSWLTSRINEFIDLYPDVHLELLLTDDELDLGMREADVGIRLRLPSQSDLIQRRLFTVHFHIYAASSYLKRYGAPTSLADLDNHRIIIFGEHAPENLKKMNWLTTAGTKSNVHREPAMRINNVVAMKLAVQRGSGVAMLPDYLLENEPGLVRLLPETEVPSLDSYLVYPPELKNTARLKAFRDFLISKAVQWTY